MAKRVQKAKEPVTIRFKQLKGGNQSIYFDIRKDGKRWYEFPKLYLIPENTPFAKEQNKNTLQAANAIKAQRIIEMANDSAGIKNTQRGKILLLDWLNEFKRLKADKSETVKQIEQVIKRVFEYNNGDKIRLCDIDKDYCLGFIRYITKEYRTQTGKLISNATALKHCRRLNSAFNEAVRRDLIPKNPFGTLSPSDKIKTPESKRTFLTIDELKTMIETPCGNEVIKSAYLFSCFCGLRLSDIRRLTWGDIKTNGNPQLTIIQKKTQNTLYLPLSKEALKHLPNRDKKADSEPIFSLPTSLATIEKHLKRWAAEAGITKNVTFHTARHTFATILCTKDVPVLTVSKLLGHTDIKNTLIYAKIVDAKKIEAVNLLDNL